jgi:hypothetical protein
MKKILIISAFVISTWMSCSLNKEPKVENMTSGEFVKWQLISMSGNISTIPPATGSDMEWQEWYILYADSSFTKTRDRNNSVTEAAGTYRFITLSDGQYLELTYPSANSLIGNCVADLKELLMLKSESELTGTWLACDGPGLVYKKVEVSE